jgi:hypothetical protein
LLVVVDDNEPPWLAIIYFILFLGVANDDEPPWACRHFFVYFSGVVDDDQPPGSLSFLSFFLKCRR